MNRLNMDHQYDFLVIGSGLAGLTYALEGSRIRKGCHCYQSFVE